MINKKSEVVTVEFHPIWLDFIVPERFNNAELNRIVTFFVFHSPCSELSAMSKSLGEYGWDAPWRKPQYLQRKLKATSTNGDLLFSAQTINDMRQALEKADLLEDIMTNPGVERIAVYNNKKNQFMSVFYHLRNAFAHGRLNMVDIGLEDDYAFIFEDVTKRKESYRVTARMILRKSTLIKWIDLIEIGHQLISNRKGQDSQNGQ